MGVKEDARGMVVLNDPMIDIAGQAMLGCKSINKFGRSTNVDNGINTDIWDRANIIQDQDIWVAPTQARVHNIVSTSASDDGSPVGGGARTLRVHGLTDWDNAEVSEDVVLNGTNNVATTNSYTIIHRMKVLTKGATSSNVGLITATAQTDGTVTAQISADKGQTQMAIYGVPSTQVAYITNFYAWVLAVASGKEVKIALLVNPEPDNELINFLTKHTLGIGGGGTTAYQHFFKPYKQIEGPAIIKMQGVGDADNMDVSAGFDLVLNNN